MSSSESPPERPRLIDRLSSRQGITLVAIITIFLLLAASGGGYYIYRNLPTPTPTPLNLESFTPPPSLEELAALYPEYADILTDPALDSAYKDFLVAYQQGGVDGAIELAQTRGMINRDGELMVTLELDITDTSEVEAQLAGQGVVVKTTAIIGDHAMLDLGIPQELIRTQLESDDPTAIFKNLTSLEHVTRVRLPEISIPGDESLDGVGGESLPVINADAWHAAGITGDGIKIGILDMGFDGYRSLLGSDLPSNFVVQSFISGTEPDATGIIHGAAVAEVIHDVAPGAMLYGASYNTGAEWVNAVNWLVSQGVDVISMSCIWSFGPKDGSSWQSQKVDEIVRSGIVWVNSAGNYAELHYRGTYSDSDGDGLHEFRPGDETMSFTSWRPTYFVVLWDDWDGATEDYDIFLLDDNQNVVAQGNDRAGEAGESISYTFPNSTPYYLVIQGVTVTRPAVFDFISYGGEIEYPVADHSLAIPADAFEVFAVAATNWSNDILEDYSSQGPTDDGRIKPDISAPTSVENASYGALGRTFSGTSAAAPHVAGAAALVLQGYPSYSPDDVKSYLKSNAYDLGPGGQDTAFGFGRLWLGSVPGAMEPTLTLTLPVPPTPIFTIPPTVGVGVTPGLPPTTEPTVYGGLPPGGEPSSPTNTLPLVLMGGVCCLGVLGIGGLVLLGIILASGRKPRRKPPAYPQAYYGPPAYTPPPPPPQVVCPRCRNVVQANASSCPYCGQALQVAPPPAVTYCRYCRGVMRPGSHFCPHCGRVQ